MSEETLIRHCSPTLAGLKTGNLFGCEYPTKEALYQEIRQFNHRLSQKGVRVIPLQYEKQRALIYVYRPERLKQDFDCCAVCQILKQQGYQNPDIYQCIAKLKQRIHTEKEFPHEIGLFLGYPPEDVAGFMKHAPCKCTGCWKVYGDPEKALQLFAAFRKCTECNLRKFENGCVLEDLTVSA